MIAVEWQRQSHCTCLDIGIIAQPVVQAERAKVAWRDVRLAIHEHAEHVARHGTGWEGNATENARLSLAFANAGVGGGSLPRGSGRSLAPRDPCEGKRANRVRVRPNRSPKQVRTEPTPISRPWWNRLFGVLSMRMPWHRRAAHVDTCRSRRAWEHSERYLTRVATASWQN
eukprot:365603-Chlamydomonas_euryale.AAC.11